MWVHGHLKIEKFKIKEISSRNIGGVGGDIFVKNTVHMNLKNLTLNALIIPFDEPCSLGKVLSNMVGIYSQIKKI